MEANSVDKAGTQYPTEQMGLRKDNIETNDGSSMKLELAIDSTQKCTHLESNNEFGAGAGANAGSRENLMFMATHSLSELVWYPHTGLGVKCADSSGGEKRTSFSWGMKSSTMVSSPPLIVTVRETKDVEPSANVNISSPQTGCSLDCQASDRIILLQAPGSNKDAMPLNQTNHEIGSSGEMKELANKMEGSLIKINHDDHLNQKEKGVSSPTNSFAMQKNIEPNVIETGFISVPENERMVDPSSSGMNEDKLALARIDPEHGKTGQGTSSDPFDRNRDVGSGNDIATHADVALASEASVIKQCKLPDNPMPFLTPPDSTNDGLALVIKEDGKCKLPVGSLNVPPSDKTESISENHFQSQKGESACAEVDIALGPADEFKVKLLRNKGKHPMVDTASGEASPYNSRICLYRGEDKDKEKVLCKIEDNRRIQKVEDDSHGSAESCNSTGLCLTGKRPWSSEQQLVTGNKKLKQSDDSLHCASFQRHDSSFVNWVLNMVKGASKSYPDGSPRLDLITTSHNEHGSQDQQIMLQEKNQRSGCKNMGFETIFKALYCPRRDLKDSCILSLDHQPKENSEERDLANKICGNSTIPHPHACGEENDKLFKATIFSKKNRVMHEDGVGPSSLPNIPPANIGAPKDDLKSDATENFNSFNIACGLVKGGEFLPNATFQNDSDSPSEGKEAYKLKLLDSNKSLNSATDINIPPESLWITRFSPKITGAVINSFPSNQNVGADVDVEGSAENCREPSSEDRADVANKKMWNSLADSVGSFGSIRIPEHTDQKFKSKLNPIQPSQRFKTSEAMASLFARRLDALRHIMPLEVSGNTSHLSTTCFFCGIKGHKLQDCSEVTESELEDLLKRISSLDGAKNFSCLCICCFQLNHWAAECPTKSLRKRSHSDGSLSLLGFRNAGKMVQISGDDAITKNDEKRAPGRKIWGCPEALTVHNGKKAKVDTGVAPGTNVCQKSSEMMNLNESTLDFKQPKKDLLVQDFCGRTSVKNTSRENIRNQKHSKTSSSTENESKECQISSFCNFVNKQIPAVPWETFDAVKRLRLSRTDIIKWMNSPISLSCLEGFYLRLRLRKWEKERGGTGYYVARISDVLKDRSSGSSKIPLSVNIGGFKCSVESRFVSNQDFVEDELMAWWCSTLKCGGKLPSEEDVKMKLQERKKFGL